jgi:hypothetical protein
VGSERKFVSRGCWVWVRGSESSLSEAFYIATSRHIRKSTERSKVRLLLADTATKLALSIGLVGPSDPPVEGASGTSESELAKRHRTHLRGLNAKYKGEP